jgi:hypothetical protein
MVTTHNKKPIPENVLMYKRFIIIFVVSIGTSFNKRALIIQRIQKKNGKSIPKIAKAFFIRKK